MQKHKLENFTRGWLVGDFSPTILPSKDFEFMVRAYKKGDVEAKHVHRIAHEITVAVTGRYKMNGEILEQGDVIHLNPGDSADFECLEDGWTAVVKTPSIKGDKYLV